MKRETVFQGFFLALFVLTLYQFFVIVEPLLTPLLGAVVLAIVSFPIHRALSRMCPRWNASSQAALSTVAIVACIVVPFAALLGLLIKESANIVPLAQETASLLWSWYQTQAQPWLVKMLPLAHRLPLVSQLTGDDLQKAASLLSEGFFGRISAIGRVLAANTLLTVLNLFILVFALFFMLRDGERVLGNLRKWLPMQNRDKERILVRVETTVLGVVRGSVLTVIWQTICATLGYLIVGLPAAVTLGLLTGIAAVIPVIGTALIWAPTAVYLLVLSSAWRGIFLLIWGGVVISLSDNLVRTYFIGRHAKLPIFLLFLGVLGGLRVYGLRGLLLGPLLVAVIPVLLDIFEAQYLSEK